MVTTRPDVQRRHRERRDQTRARILAVAGELLEDRPWSEVSIEEITRRAELTRTAFYRHFPDRQTLLLALLEDLGLRLDLVADPWEGAAGDPTELMQQSLRELVEVFLRHGRLLRAIADAATQDRQIAATYAELGARLTSSAAARIAADVAAGRSSVADPQEVAGALVWMNERYLLERFGRAPLGDPDRAAAALAEVWERAVYGFARPGPEDDRALVARAITFERDCLALAADRREEHPLGLWIRSSAHPQLWTLNQLHVLGRHPELTAAALMAELDAGLADAAHRHVSVADDATGRRLADDFRAAGWRVGPALVMLLDREPPEPAPGVAREVDEAAMRALEAQTVREDAGIPADSEPMVLAGHAHVRATVPGTRMFVGAHDGVDACHATLFTDGRTGQPESVVTLSEHEGHGLAAATVSVATRAAQSAGCDLVFIICHGDTGPVALYSRLGFRAAGRYWTFTRPG